MSDVIKTQRLALSISGRIQGIGIRPALSRLSKKHQLKGFVKNTHDGVYLEIEGEESSLEKFKLEWLEVIPSEASIENSTIQTVKTKGDDSFQILTSTIANHSPFSSVQPDHALCKTCLDELFDENNRRFHYPFITCAQCGPRYTIIEQEPFERINTSMRDFELCRTCQEEYTNSDDRRFHAQTISCHDCGPSIEYYSSHSDTICRHTQALKQAIEDIKLGKIIAVKSLGGFQLLCLTHEPIVKKLRERKKRKSKAFALMFPDLDQVENLCKLNLQEKTLLTSAAAPIVLLDIDQSNLNNNISKLIHPDQNTLGVMLPYTPLHHLILRELGQPLVATSANYHDELLCTDNASALELLGNLADSVLTHNRRISKHADDSVVRVIAVKTQTFRRARGYVPNCLTLENAHQNSLAMGGQLKNTISIVVDQKCFCSPYIGDLDHSKTLTAHRELFKNYRSALGTNNFNIVHDHHPDYASSIEAQAINQTKLSIQHHHAHVLSCMAEHKIEEPVLGVSWDGTGLGEDQSLWGSEFLLCHGRKKERIACIRPFTLPGGEQAIREPRRACLGLLHQLNTEAYTEVLAPIFSQTFSEQELSFIQTMLKKSVQCTQTSSAGRLFDVIAFLLGQAAVHDYEGQAAIQLETLAEKATLRELRYQLKIINSEQLNCILDWETLVLDILQDLKQKHKPEEIAYSFHLALADSIVQIARQCKQQKVVLSGGCFQNRILLENSIRMLRENQFDVYWNQRYPCNDGGLSVGQAYYASLSEDHPSCV